MINTAIAYRNIHGAAQLLLPTLFSAQTLLPSLLSLSPSSLGLIKVRSEGGQLQALPLAGRGRICFFFSKGVIRAGWVHLLITHAGEECSLIMKFACCRAGGTGGTSNLLGNACLSIPLGLGGLWEELEAVGWRDGAGSELDDARCGRKGL